MARIRSIKPEFWTSEQVVDCSPTARLLFIGMWTHADDAGRLPASARRLKMQVFPADDIDAQAVEALVLELRRARLVVEYEHEGEVFWAVTGWARHQRVEKPTVRYPAPEDSILRPLAEGSERSRQRSGVEWSGEEKTPHTHTPVQETAREPKRADPARLVPMPTPMAATFSTIAVGHNTTSSPETPREVVSSPMPPTAPPPGVRPPLRIPGKPPTPPKDDDALKPFFAAFCRGANLPLTWHARYILHAERIAASGLSPERVRAVAAHYRAKLRDGAPSLPAFASDVDRWNADLRATEAPAARTAEADPDKCPKHPGVSIADGPCDLCRTVAELERGADNWNPPVLIHGGRQ